MSLPDGNTDIYNEFFELSKLNDSIPAPADGKIISVPSTATVRAATRILAQANVLSAPIKAVDAPDDADWVEKYVGTVDAVNLCYWMLDQTDGSVPDDLGELLKESFADTPIVEVVNADPDTSRFNPFIPLDPKNNTMLDVMLLLGKYAQHRAFVVETGGDITNIVTQSAVVKFLKNFKDRMAPTIHKTLKELNLAPAAKPVATVTGDDTFWTAFKLMKEKAVSAVPLVDEVGVIKGVVSARDARLLVVRPTRLRFVNQPLSLFEELHIEPFNYATVCCTVDSTLEDVIDKFIATQVHRVFVVDDNQHVVGVVSLRDVITTMVQEPKDSPIADYFVGKAA
jgi:CBS domain-containing protein